MITGQCHNIGSIGLWIQNQLLKEVIFKELLVLSTKDSEKDMYADEFGVHVDDYINSMVLKQVSDDRRLVVVRKVAWI